MSNARSSIAPPGKRSGKQPDGDLNVGKAHAVAGIGRLSKALAHPVTLSSGGLCSSLSMPKVAGSPPHFASGCFPPASPILRAQAGKQKTAPKGRFKQLISLKEIGAGEGIRTLDPNLGKVVLYP